MVKLVRLHLGKNPAQRGSVREIAVMEKKRLAVNVFVAAQMLDARTREIARPPDDAVDRVAFFQEQLREIRAVLSGNAGNQCGFFVFGHGSGTPVTTIQRTHPFPQDRTFRIKERRFTNRRWFWSAVCKPPLLEVNSTGAFCFVSR